MRFTARAPSTTLLRSVVSLPRFAGQDAEKARPYQETTRTRSNNSAFINDAGPPTTRP